MPGVRSAQREHTREQLIVTARALFAERGFAAVGLAEIVRTAGVTKGALYHHFADGKTALFAAVVTRVGEEVGEAVSAAAEHAAAEHAAAQYEAGRAAEAVSGNSETASEGRAGSGSGASGDGSAWAALRAGCRAFLDHSTAPGVARILLLDGPAVLGPARWRELDDAASGRHLVEALDALVADGTLVARPVEPLARLLSGAMNEAAVWLAGDGTGCEVALREATGRELDGLLTSLRRHP